MSDLLNELRPESDGAFDDAWAAKFGGPEVQDTQPDITEEVPAEADTTDPEGQPRDDQGRFARVDTPAVDEGSLELPEEPAQTEEPDEYAKTLAKYGGDPEATVRGLIELDKMRSRQTDELGELRRQVAELQTREQPQPAQPQFQRSITEHDVERLDEAASGGGQAAQAAFEQAAQLDPSGQLAKRVLDTWATVAPSEATVYIANKMAEEKTAALRAEFEPVLADRAQTAEDQKFVQAWEGLKGEMPELDQLAPALEKVLSERPGIVRSILAAEDVETKQDLLRTAAESAKLLQDPVVQEGVQAVQAEEAEASRQAKIAAGVTRPVAQVGSVPGGGNSELSELQKQGQAIKERMLQAPSTNLIDGWSTD